MKIKKIFYISKILDQTHRGWIKADIEGENEVFLPYLTKVKLIEECEDYEKVKILNGKYSNKIARLTSLLDSKNGYYSSLEEIVKKKKYKNNIMVDLKKQKLIFNKNEIDIVADPSKFDTKEYSILYPIKSHKNVFSYLNEDKGGSRFAETWFPIQSINKEPTCQYLHFGKISDGCLTIKIDGSCRAQRSWNTLFLSLLKSNKNGILGYINIV